LTLLDLHFNNEGVDEGRPSALTKITANEKKQTIEIENWGDAPAHVAEVKPLRQRFVAKRVSVLRLEDR
jgi:hypothetical protein